MVQSWWILLLASHNNFKTMPDIRCSTIITLSPSQSTLLCTTLYSSVVIDIDNYLTLEPSCWHWFSTRLTWQAWLPCKWERNGASLNPAIYLRCFTSNGVSIIRVFIEKPCLNCRASLPPFWNSNVDLVSYCILINFTNIHWPDMFCKLPIVDQ